MGWRNNSEARTPNMNALVKEGVILDRHYVYQYCSPTRSSFLSGRLPIHVNTVNRGPDQIGGVDLRMTMISSKLKSAGYSTHQVGKWNAGSTAWGNMPINRGFDSSYGYMGGAEDHYTQHGDYKIKYENGELGYTSAVDLWENDGPAYGKNGTYNAYSFAQHAVDIISNHDPSTPLFIYQAWQEAHTPNEVPAEFLGPVLPKDKSDGLRRTYEGMVHCLDSGIGNVTAALKAKGMWEKTLVVFSADNGGREDMDFGGNNYPLRGMKFSDFEGGVRVAAFAAGGVIPQARRGSTETGMIHISDWYHTYCALAGVDSTDTKAAASTDKIPPIDSQNVWAVLSTGGASPHLPANRPDGLVISAAAVIIWPYKLVTGKQKGKGVWTGRRHPNTTKLLDDDKGCGGSSEYLDAMAECGGDYGCIGTRDVSQALSKEVSGVGCLFNIESDPTEHVDLSAVPAHASTLQALRAALAKAVASQFQTNTAPGYDNCTTNAEYINNHHGFGGPLCYNGSIPGGLM
jgi:arylsulfatase I/J